MFDPIKILGILLVQAVVSQVHKVILLTIASSFRKKIQIIFLARQPHEAIIVEEDGQRVYHRGDQHVDAEVKFVPVNKRWVFYVFLYYIGIILFHSCRRFSKVIIIVGCIGCLHTAAIVSALSKYKRERCILNAIRVLCSCVIMMLHLNVLFVLFLLCL